MKLSEFELDIMQLLWQHEPCTASQLHKALLADTRKSKVCALETSGISKQKHAILILLSFTKISPNNLTPVIFQK